jgi:hypothetical protein
VVPATLAFFIGIKFVFDGKGICINYQDFLKKYGKRNKKIKNISKKFG